MHRVCVEPRGVGEDGERIAFQRSRREDVDDVILEFHLDRPFDPAFKFGDARLVAFVERPLFDPLPAKQPRIDQDAQVLARCRLAHAELFRDEEAAHAVVDEIAVDLLAKMGSRILEPLQNDQPSVTCEGTQRGLEAGDIYLLRHIANLPCDE